MGDNLQPAGLAAPVATDQLLDGSHAQRIKLLVSADGEGTHIPATADKGLRVETVPAGGALTDRSGEIAGAGQSQQVMAANAARRYLFFQNLSDDAVMWVGFGVDAVAGQPSRRVGPMQNFAFGGGFVPTQALNVLCAAQGAQFCAQEG